MRSNIDGPEDRKQHDKIHPDNKKGHFCWEWDFLYICEHCKEFHCCNCFSANSGLITITERRSGS